MYINNDCLSSPSPHAQHRVHVAVAIWFSGSLDLKQLFSQAEDCMGMLGETNEKLSLFSRAT